MEAFMLALAFAVGAGTAAAAKPAQKDVVLIGTVTAIDELHTEFAVDRLAITVSVDKVVSGNLTDTTIKFVLPVAARDLLEVRGSYEIQAKRTTGGYVVGETDIRKIKTAPGAKPSKDLLLVATVTAIKNTYDLHKPWLVSTRVEKILSGDLSGRTFRFAVLSPEQAGLKVGKRYTIPAHWTGRDYQVDELNVWRHNH
jgi:hypothetical protein